MTIRFLKELLLLGNEMVDPDKLQTYCQRLEGIEDQDQTFENMILKLDSLGSIMEEFERNYTLSELEERIREKVNSDYSFPYEEVAENLRRAGRYAFAVNLIPLFLVEAVNDEIPDEMKDPVKKGRREMTLGGLILGLSTNLKNKKGDYRVKEFSKDIKGLVREFKKVKQISKQVR